MMHERLAKYINTAHIYYGCFSEIRTTADDSGGFANKKQHASKSFCIPVKYEHESERPWIWRPLTRIIIGLKECTKARALFLYFLIIEI